MPACKDADGRVIPCPEPPGGPPVAVPGGDEGTHWVNIGPAGPGARDRWKPNAPVPSPKGGQPVGSWDPRHGHWDVKDGQGTTRRYLPDGTEVDHDNKPVGQPGSSDVPQVNPPSAMVIVASILTGIITLVTRAPVPLP